MLSYRTRVVLALIPFRVRARNVALRAVRAYGDWTDYVLTQATIKLDPELYDDDLYGHQLSIFRADDLFDVFGDDDEF